MLSFLFPTQLAGVKYDRNENMGLDCLTHSMKDCSVLSYILGVLFLKTPSLTLAK